MFSCKKACLPAEREKGTDLQAQEATPTVNNKKSAKKYKPSDWTIRPFGYDFSVRNLELLGSKNKGC